MIKFEHIEVVGLEVAIRGMRNPMNSWEKSDSGYKCPYLKPEVGQTPKCCRENMCIGPNDLDLMKRLRNAGTDHRKFMRMIMVYVDITAPLYWWKEFDTYKVGTVANSCSTMHKIAEKEFEIGDFSHEYLMNLINAEYGDALFLEGTNLRVDAGDLLGLTINVLNYYRKRYLDTRDKQYWRQMIQLLPSSYNQKRTVMLNYEVLAGLYSMQKNHKLDEWREFCRWIDNLPYSEIVIGEESTTIHCKIDAVDVMMDAYIASSRLNRRINTCLHGKDGMVMQEILAKNTSQLGLCLKLLYSENVDFTVTVRENEKLKIEYSVIVDVDQKKFEKLKVIYRILIS